MGEGSIDKLVSTGIPGLDDVLGGGLPERKIHIVSGSPGTGKTTFALRFVAEGIDRGERCLYITVSGGEKTFTDLAEAGGVALVPTLFSIHAVKISPDILKGPEERIFHPAESEPADAMKELLAEIARVKPKRLVIDSLSDLRLIFEDPTSFRRLVLATRQEFSGEESTVIITNNAGINPSGVDLHLESVCHGVIYLEQVVAGYGPVRRRLLVVKMRGRAYRTGWHDFRIVTGGISVFPTLVAGEHTGTASKEQLSSGNIGLDHLCGGGVDRGSAVAIIGASGTGKTTIANRFVAAAAERGQYCVVYLFEETVESYLERADGLGIGVKDYLDKGLLSLNHVDVSELSAGEFTAMLRREVEEKGAAIIVIDTLGGYANAMSGEQFLTLQLRELVTYFSYKGVTLLMVVEQHGLVGHSALDLDVKNVSFLADSILLLRFFELRGEIRRAVSVIKKRRGYHERSICEMTLSKEGITVGAQLVDMQGVLTGVPILEV